MRLLKFASEVRATADGTITAVLSTESVDRDGDVVRLDGWDLGNFSKAPRLLSCHDYGRLTSQIGEWRNVHVDPERKALVGDAHYYTGQGNVEADWAYFLASQGQATYSVGFMPKESQPRKGANGGRVYTGQELLEVSHVPVPSQPDALQLMAKAARWTEGTRSKWDSAYMPDDSGVSDPYGYGGSVLEKRCIVPGCDDASQTNVVICSEHLKYLMNADPEPAGSPPDDDDGIISLSALRGLVRVAKSGRAISSANMGKLHSAMQSLNDVHDGACSADDCPLSDGDDSKGPPTGKAAGEGSGSGGGSLVCPFCHPKSAVNTDDPAKCNCKADCGEGKCPKAESSKAADGETNTRAIVDDKKSPSGDIASPATQYLTSIEDAMTKALEVHGW